MLRGQEKKNIENPTMIHYFLSLTIFKNGFLYYELEEQCDYQVRGNFKVFVSEQMWVELIQDKDIFDHHTSV